MVVSRKHKFVSIFVIILIISLLLYNKNNANNVAQYVERFFTNESTLTNTFRKVLVEDTARCHPTYPPRLLLLPNDILLDNMNKTELWELYWRYINSIQVLCRNQTRFGSMRDGGKEICLDNLYKPRYPCLVYSFGSNFQFDFENSVIQNFQCEVHTFDPSKKLKGSVPHGISFHFIGISNKTYTNELKWNMSTLSDIRKSLNHENAGCVWATMTSAANSNIGRKFYISSFVWGERYTNNISIDVASKQEGNLQLTIPFLHIRENKTLSKGNTTISLDKSLFKVGTFLENRGVGLETDVPVSVVVTAFLEYDVADSYLALPLSALGTSYKAAAFQPRYELSKSYLLYVGTTSNTSVITKYVNGTANLQTLQKYDVLQFERDSDLTDITVKSDKPIVVVSGTSCTTIPMSVDTCDCLIEQMLPEYVWEHVFIVPPLYPKKGFLVRLMTFQNSTFHLQNTSNTISGNMSSKTNSTFLMGLDPVVVTSTAKISVVQYGLKRNYDFLGGDAFLTVIPPIEHYTNEYIFVIPSAYKPFTYYRYLAIIVPATDAGGILLDESPLRILKQYNVTKPYDNYTVIIVHVSIGYHELRHRNHLVKFGATAYGLGSDVGFGFPLGFQFATHPVPDTTITAAKTTTRPATVISTSTMTVTSTTLEAENTTCFSCEDMRHLELCDVIQHCRKGQVCFIEMYTKSLSTLFRSGCLQKETCDLELELSSHATNRCVECCRGNFCNYKGCGDTGMPPREQRGPICYDCQHAWSPSECNTIKLCGQGQTCSIEEFEWGDHSQFKMGCAYRLCSPTDRVVSVTSRSLPLCHACCEDDFCNSNCTRTTQDQSGSVIVG